MVSVIETQQKQKAKIERLWDKNGFSRKRNSHTDRDRKREKN